MALRGGACAPAASVMPGAVASRARAFVDTSEAVGGRCGRGARSGEEGGGRTDGEAVRPGDATWPDATRRDALRSPSLGGRQESPLRRPWTLLDSAERRAQNNLNVVLIFYFF